eukprot:TRINITY_DN36050_c0_g1_i1.p1 TRINITY_DN36050_c0_g1~~TRINITY_DN36050_c0_g1_i1.p1  ORF type:complete len:170 (-),score=13.06 TRINITY_DN36050_c0_g1_i1:131-640(-)
MWRLVLCYLRPAQRLRLVFVGNEMEDHKSLALEHWPEGNWWEVKFVQALYQDYRTQACFEVPDLAIAFNAGLHAYDGWAKAIDSLMELCIPVVITIRDSEEDKELAVLRELGANITRPPTLNPFRSLEPNLRTGNDCLFESDNKSYVCFKGPAAAKRRRVTATQVTANV